MYESVKGVMLFFCIEHIQSHLTTKVCHWCEVEKCSEWFDVSFVMKSQKSYDCENTCWKPDICYFCNTSALPLSSLVKNSTPDSDLITKSS